MNTIARPLENRVAHQSGTVASAQQCSYYYHMPHLIDAQKMEAVDDIDDSSKASSCVHVESLQSIVEQPAFMLKAH